MLDVMFYQMRAKTRKKNNFENPAGEKEIQMKKYAQIRLVNSVRVFVLLWGKHKIFGFRSQSYGRRY